MLKNRERHHSDDAVKKGYELRCEKLRCASLRSALQRCGALSLSQLARHPATSLENAGSCCNNVCATPCSAMDSTDVTLRYVHFE